MLDDSVRRELRREVDLGSIARARVMSAVRRETVRPLRRGWISPVTAIALAASAVLTITGGAVQRAATGRESSSFAHLDTLAVIRTMVQTAHHFPVVADMTRVAPDSL
jgi:hypothetical protein